MATRTSTLQGISAPAAPTASNGATPTPKVRSYKDFLTPAMHRRFTQATFAILLLCYVEAVFMSQASIIWRLIPFGVTGIRTLLLFMPCLGVFIIRLANLHVGERNTTAGYETFYQLFTAGRTYFTLGWYTYSAFFFGEVYIWSRGQEANLGWVDFGRSYEKPRLNENPIALRSLYMVLSVIQTCLHFYFDYDLVSISQEEQESVRQTDAPKLPSAYVELKSRLGAKLHWAFNVALAGALAVIPLYFLLIRQKAWSVCHGIGRILFSDLPRNAAPTGFVHFPGLVWQAMTSAFMLAVLWEISNHVFTASVASPPLKKDYPLTNEVKDAAGNILSKSVDPNGSLLTGLKSKREVPKTFAFWELHLVSKHFAARRKTLFTDVDRKDGATWTQLTTACLSEIEAIRTRIHTALEPVKGNAAVAEAELQRKQHEFLVANPNQANLTLPKIANRSVQDADVLVHQQSTYFPDSVGSFAKRVGQHPNAPNPLTPGRKGKQLLDWGSGKVLTPSQRAQLSRQGFTSQTTSYALRFLRTPLGIPFRQSFARKVRVVIFGIPHSNRVNIVHAIRSLTTLLVASLEEDEFGLPSKDVPRIVRSLTSTIKEIRVFVASSEPEWTDVEFDGRRSVPDVQEVVGELERGLGAVMLAFGEYASSLGLSKKEVREAKEVAGSGGVEMAGRSR